MLPRGEAEPEFRLYGRQSGSRVEDRGRLVVSDDLCDLSGRLILRVVRLRDAVIIVDPDEVAVLAQVDERHVDLVLCDLRIAPLNPGDDVRTVVVHVSVFFVVVYNGQHFF